jgi:AI-2 transport protein TqsA
MVVFLSLVFWGWMWGPAGMLLSVPLTVVVRSVMAHRPETAWLATLLGPNRPA